MGKLPISEIKIYKNLDEVKLQPNEILVAWEVNSQTEKEIDIRGAYGWYNSVTEAKKEQKKFPENILFEVGSKQDFAWNIWFGAKKIANDLEGEELENFLDVLSDEEFEEVFA